MHYTQPHFIVVVFSSNCCGGSDTDREQLFFALREIVETSTECPAARECSPHKFPGFTASVTITLASFFSQHSWLVSESRAEAWKNKSPPKTTTVLAMLSTSVAIASLWQAINLSCYSSAINPVCVTVFFSLFFSDTFIFSASSRRRETAQHWMCAAAVTHARRFERFILSLRITHWKLMETAEQGVVSLHGRHTRNIYHTKKIVVKKLKCSKVNFFSSCVLIFSRYQLDFIAQSHPL